MKKIPLSSSYFSDLIFQIPRLESEIVWYNNSEILTDIINKHQQQTKTSLGPKLITEMSMKNPDNIESKTFKSNNQYVVDWSMVWLENR